MEEDERGTRRETTVKRMKNSRMAGCLYSARGWYVDATRLRQVIMERENRCE